VIPPTLFVVVFQALIFKVAHRRQGNKNCKEISSLLLGSHILEEINHNKKSPIKEQGEAKKTPEFTKAPAFYIIYLIEFVHPGQTKTSILVNHMQRMKSLDSWTNMFII